MMSALPTRDAHHTLQHRDADHRIALFELIHPPAHSEVKSSQWTYHLGHARALAATAGRTVVMADLDRMKTVGRSK